MRKGSALTGAAASKLWTLSIGQAGLDRRHHEPLRHDAGRRDDATISSGAAALLIGENAAATEILRLSTPGSLFAVDTIAHLMWSVDMANAANRWCRINGINRTLTVTTYIDDTINWATTEECFGANPVAGRVRRVFR